MTTGQTADLLAEVQALIRERERDGVRGLADRVGPVRVGGPRPACSSRARSPSSSTGCPTRSSPRSSPSSPRPTRRRSCGRSAATEAADLLEEMDPDDAVGRRRAPSRGGRPGDPRSGCSPDEASELRDLTRYPPDTAGGIMTPAFVAVAADATRRAGDRRHPPARRRRRDRQLHLRHRPGPASSSACCRSYRLLLSPAETPVRELMAPSTVRVRADADREVAARLLTDRNLLALPVVDDADHLLGIITEDDVADVLEAEATEDIERLGGSRAAERAVPLVGRPAARPQARRLAAAAVRRRGLHGHRPPRLPGRAGPGRSR